ncbi:MAG: tRNA lysidine(34) synthetase TilS [Deltaproteobacteria bacterium]|nr:tRNA lysidine(34) synthetase TilS [Deltaproteobacteria bacterium]
MPVSGSQELIQKFIKTVTDYQMFQDGDSVLVGVSGGSDSVALIHAFMKISSRFSLQLGVAHLNHALRGEESEKDARFVATLARTHELLFFSKTVNIPQLQKQFGGSLETHGRRERYRFFLKIAGTEGYDQISLGHHADDNAELVLMNLIRGSGLKGVSGIPPVRTGNRGQCRIIRPLIRCTKDEIIAFLNREELSYRVDRSNENMTFLRNRVRHQLLPMLRESYNPGIDAALNRFAIISRSDDVWMNSEARSLFEEALLKADVDRIVLDIHRLRKMFPAVQRRVLREAIRRVKGDLRRIRFDHIASALTFLNEEDCRGSIDLPGRIRVQCGFGTLVVVREAAPLRELKTGDGISPGIEYQYKIHGPCTVDIKEVPMRFTFSRVHRTQVSTLVGSGDLTAYFDMDKLAFPLVLRNPRPGDRFWPLGMKGTQKVSRFLMNNKVPRSDRARRPVMTSREKVVWVVGYRIDASVKIGDNTRTVLKAEFSLA